VHDDAGEHREAALVDGGLRVGVPGRHAVAVGDGDLLDRDAVELAHVVVRVVGEACLQGRVDDRLLHRVERLVGRDRQRPVGTPACVGGTVPLLDAPVHGLDVRPGPAGAAIGRPAVEVLGGAAHPDRGVQGVGPAEHAPARQVDPPSGSVWLRHRVVAPVTLPVPELAEAPHVLDHVVAVGPARLEDRHPAPGVRQTAGDDAP
jgi:hypothetical protein